MSGDYGFEVNLQLMPAVNVVNTAATVAYCGIPRDIEVVMRNERGGGLLVASRGVQRGGLVP